MKMKMNAVLLALLSASVFLNGCSKKEESAPPAASQTPAAPAAANLEKAVTATADKAAAAVDSAVSGAQKAAANVAAEAQKQAVEVQATAVPPVTQVVKTPAAAPAPPAPPAQTAVQNILDRTKNLLNEKKYPEALAALGELSSVNLTSEQQKLVEQLKAQIQNAMTQQTANDGLKAVGGLLNKKN